MDVRQSSRGANSNAGYNGRKELAVAEEQPRAKMLALLSFGVGVSLSSEADGCRAMAGARAGFRAWSFTDAWGTERSESQVAQSRVRSNGECQQLQLELRMSEVKH